MHLTLAFVAGLVLAWSAAAPAQGRAAYDESRIKAAYLMRFGQYVEWPAAALQKGGSTLTIGVLNSDAVLKGLQELAAERTSGRPVQIRAVKAAESAADVHILFIGAAEKTRIAEHCAALAGKPILIVTESADAIQHGAVINFLLIEQRVRFEIAVDRAEKAGLVVSSRLLSVAARVYRGEIPPEVMFALAMLESDAQMNR